MAKCSLENPTRCLCFSVLACFLLSAIPSQAKEAGKPPILRRALPQDSTGSAAPQLSQNKTSDQPPLAPDLSTPPKTASDTKSGEETSGANSVAVLAKLATDMNETVRRIETFYSNTVLLFLSLLTAVATLVGVAGVISVKNIANKTASRRAKKALEPHLSDYKSMREEYNKLSRDFDDFKQSAVKNLSSLRSATLARSNMVSYMQDLGKASDADKLNATLRREEARRFVSEVLNEIKPDDKIVLSLTHSVYGNILYFDNNFESALDVLRKAVLEDDKNSPAAYNLACCASKLADELANKGNGYKAQIYSLENEALTSLERTLRLEPWRKTQMQNETDFLRLREHPRFKALIFG